MNTKIDLISIKNRIEELEEIVDRITESFDKKWFSKENLESLDRISAEDGFKKYTEERKKAVGKEGEELTNLLVKERMNREPKFSSIPDFGDVMSLSTFIDNVKDGGFIDYDGHGNYLKEDKMTDIEIYPSDIKKGNLRKEFDRIIWFNK
jgi:hypothetical protein